METDFMPMSDIKETPLDTFITGTGEKFYTDYFVYSENPPFAFIRVLGKNIVECTTIFSDSKVTEKLVYNGQVLEGYTNLMSVSNEKPAVKIQLSR